MCIRDRIYTAQKRANLPENIKTVLMMDDIDTATLLLDEGIEVNKRLCEQRIYGVDLESMARKMCIRDRSGPCTPPPEIRSYPPAA